MSWSFAVPAGPSTEFADRAAAAKEAYEKGLEGNDYGLTQLASGQADEAIKAAQSVVDSGVLGDGAVSGSLGGHYAEAPGTSSISLSLSSVLSAPAPQ